MESLLQCTGLTKKYGNLTALNNVTLNIGSGKIVGLLGPNGSGKTTLIKLIAGLLTPDGGQITIDGNVPGVKSKAIVSYLSDKNFLTEWMRVEQMVEYFSEFYGDFRLERAHTMLAELGINEKAKIKTLSKGMREKVALILAMSRDAKLYLLDEPIAGVDPATRDYIMHTILSNYSDGATIIISTHLIADIEQILSDVVFINNGNIVLSSSADDIREREGKSVDEVFREVFRC